MPLISTGLNRYPVESVAERLVLSTLRYPRRNNKVSKVVLIDICPKKVEALEKAFDKYVASDDL